MTRIEDPGYPPPRVQRPHTVSWNKMREVGPILADAALVAGQEDVFFSHAACPSHERCVRCHAEQRGGVVRPPSGHFAEFIE
jgi:hypothetical protein